MDNEQKVWKETPEYQDTVNIIEMRRRQEQKIAEIDAAKEEETEKTKKRKAVEEAAPAFVQLYKRRNLAQQRAQESESSGSESSGSDLV